MVKHVICWLNTQPVTYFHTFKTISANQSEKCMGQTLQLSQELNLLTLGAPGTLMLLTRLGAMFHKHLLHHTTYKSDYCYHKNCMHFCQNLGEKGS